MHGSHYQHFELSEYLEDVLRRLADELAVNAARREGDLPVWRDLLDGVVKVGDAHGGDVDRGGRVALAVQGEHELVAPRGRALQIVWF